MDRVYTILIIIFLLLFMLGADYTTFYGWLTALTSGFALAVRAFVLVVTWKRRKKNANAPQ